MECAICKKLGTATNAPSLVREFKHSILLVADHQYFPGYCVLFLKEHVRELHDLSPLVQKELFEELMNSGQAIHKAFHPWKMNYSCYGNQDPHIHWHLFPRYDSEPDHKKHPWLHMDEFAKFKTEPQLALEVAEKVRRHLLA